METNNNVNPDSLLKTIIVACGGEEQLIDELLAMEQGEADPANRGQIARLATHLKDMARLRDINISIGPRVTEVRPQELECDVVRFQNNKEKWVALVGLLDGYGYTNTSYGKSDSLKFHIKRKCS